MAAPSKKLLRKSMATLATAAGLLSLGQTAFAGQQAPVTVTVAVYDYVRVPRGIVREAQEVATRIYAEIGVTLEWTNPAEVSANNADSATRKSLFTSMLLINLLSPSMEARCAAPEGVVGVTALGGRVAQVLFSRVISLAMKSRKGVDQILGHVMAHELGHLLLPLSSHSKTGLMGTHLQMADLGRLRFTGEQPDLIRTKLAEQRALSSDVPTAPAAALAADSADIR
jgi:hypothetical protein